MFHAPNKSLLKIGHCSYYTKVLELHRSNHIVDEIPEAWTPPESWMAPEALDRPLEYPPSRDIWAAGIILLQMLKGFSVTDQYQDPGDALRSIEPLPQSIIDLLLLLFTPNRKRSPSCLELTRQLSQITGPVIASSSIPIPGKLN
jgi:serine/threonine protein kinase